MTSLTGMSATTGKALSGDEHLVQSIGDIVTTPIGSRVMLREYGCYLFELIDRPLNRATLLLGAMAVTIALAKWEPRIAVTQVTFEGDFTSGQAVLNVTGNRTDVAGNALTRLTIPLSR
jgi:phage baseplate assembly protein W